jgi:hypothetical protein
MIAPLKDTDAQLLSVCVFEFPQFRGVYRVSDQLEFPGYPG